MANTPNVNRNALVLIKRFTAGTLPLGTGVVLTGNYSNDNIQLADLPTGVDGLINGVIYETAPDNINSGFMLQVGFSNVKLQIGSTSVQSGDKLNVEDSSGVWKKAAPNSKNVYYVALQSANPGELCWASPVASTSLAVGQVIQVVSAQVTTDQSTVSGSFVDLLSTDITTQAGSKLILNASFSSSNNNLAGALNSFRITIDGSAVDLNGIPYAGVGQNITLLNGIQGSAISRVINNLSADTHTVKLQWSTSAGTSRIRPLTAPGSEHASINIMEVVV